MASRIARGTVRAGFVTSPLGTSALSMPLNAKTSTMDVRPTLAIDGRAGHTRFAGCIANSPTTTKSSRGSSLATVAISITRAPCRTPRVFTKASRPNTPTITTARANPMPAPGTSALIACANRLATAACAIVPSIHSRTLLR